MGWVACIGWAELGLVRLGGVVLGCVGLDWVGLDWIGFNSIRSCLFHYGIICKCGISKTEISRKRFSTPFTGIRRL